MAQPFHSSLAVPVPGGSLHVGVAGAAPGTPGVPVVLAVHGITGSHRTWAPVARHLGEAVTLLAPDLRGRGQSAGLGGPYGMAAHVDDLVAVLDHVGCPRAVVAGHSMGGYVVDPLRRQRPRADGRGAARRRRAAAAGPARRRPRRPPRPRPRPQPGPPPDDVPVGRGLPGLLAGPPGLLRRDLDRRRRRASSTTTSARQRPARTAATAYRSRVSEDAVRADGRDLLDGGQRPQGAPLAGAIPAPSCGPAGASRTRTARSCRPRSSPTPRRCCPTWW